MKKFLVIGLMALVCDISMIGCGNDTQFDAIVVAPGDITINGNLGSLDEVALIGTQFLVQKNSNDPTPVPNANITLQSGAIGGDIWMCLKPWTAAGFPAGCSTPPGGANIIKMTTSGTGAVLVYPLLIARDCTGTSGTITGQGSIAGIISTNVGITNVSFTVKC
jgi:hypothetical protein